jgi:uncharacterized protein (DUF2062 family)
VAEPLPPDLNAVPTPVTPTPRTFLQRRVVDPIVAQLTQGITPEKIALTIAVGSTLALFPMLGVTTVLCFLAGVVLRLNQPIIQVVNYLCTPIHIPLIFYFVHLGEKLFGVPHTRVRLGEFAKLVWDDPILFAHKFGLTVFHAAVVWAIAAPVWITVIYFSARTTLREIARVRAESAARAAALVAPKVADATDHPVP